MNKDNVISLGPWTIGFGLVLSTILAFCVNGFVGILFLIGSIGCVANLIDAYTRERKIKILEEKYKNISYETRTENS